jgi:hypothetical protein
MWSYGDQIVLRYRTTGRISKVMPVTVVEDSSDCIALYQATGTPIRDAVYRDGSPIPRRIPYEERFAIDWRLGDGIWHTEARLMLARPGAAHAFSAFWDGETWAFHGWYVDLQAPLERTTQGFDSEDYLLDIVIPPNASWYWKDEDEFAAAQRVGRFSAEQAAAIRAEGESVVEVIEAGGWPLDSDWEHWRPNPGWPIPRLPNHLDP